MSFSDGTVSNYATLDTSDSVFDRPLCLPGQLTPFTSTTTSESDNALPRA